MIPSTQYPAVFPFNSQEDKISSAANNKDTIIGLNEDFIILILIKLQIINRDVTVAIRFVN
jgi:hypothetical protein